jgi:hypothetical protein
MKRLLYVICLLVLCCSCGQDKDTGTVQLYLADADLEPGESLMLGLDEIPLEAEPLLTTGDLLSYDQEEHAFALTQDACERILEPEILYRRFVVLANGERIYTGAFWTPLSSRSYDGIAILQPLSEDRCILRVDLGYPSHLTYAGKDPRNDERLLMALDQAGKLD